MGLNILPLEMLLSLLESGIAHLQCKNHLKLRIIRTTQASLSVNVFGLLFFFFLPMMFPSEKAFETLRSKHKNTGTFWRQKACFPLLNRNRIHVVEKKYSRKKSQETNKKKQPNKTSK